MKRIYILLLLVIAVISASAQQNYDVGLIPKDLLPYASSVVRNEEIKVQVDALDDALVHVKKAVTILNKNGDDMARLAIPHDKSAVIKYIRGAIYDEQGKKIAKISESDFDDANAWDGFSLFLDTKVKHYRPASISYPYTVEYEYEVKNKQTLDLPGWSPNPDIGTAVEKSSYTISCRPDFNIRYKELNFRGNVVLGNNSSGLKTYTWATTDLKAKKDEPLSPYYENYVTSVKLAPEKFSYYGVDGSFTSWEQLGKWMYDKLVADRQELPEQTVAHMREITKNIADPKLKAKKIYEYMQNKTHYVNVSVGIGGIEPFLASDVDQQNYGDCKALVNYTQALLKAVGIESYYCIVEAGREYKVGLPPDFPCIDGNHIILCLPFKNDTTWADCTSQTIPFGYLGSFTDDRNVLACTQDGAKLMHTPKYTAEDNLKSRAGDFVIDAHGMLSGTMTTTFNGADYEYRDGLVGESVAERNKDLQHIYPINNMQIESYILDQDKSFKPVTTESIRLQAKEYASFTDGKYYFMPNAANRYDDVPRNLRNRVNSVYINRGYTDIDEFTYTLPAGYHLGKQPLHVLIEKPYGVYKVTMTLKDNHLIYKRKLKVVDGTYSSDIYGDMVDFFQEVADDDSYIVTLEKD